MSERLSPKQQAIVDFLFDWISDQATSPALAEIENGTGLKANAIVDAMRYLRLRSKIICETQGYGGGGKALVVTEVRHPSKGIAAVRDAIFDPILGASYFAEDLAAMSPIVERKCLNCRARFETRGKFNRLCGVCAKDGDPTQQVAPGGYVSNALAVSAGNPAAGMGHFKRGTR